MIDIEKFICSLLADHPEGVAVRGDIHRALKEQGLEYKDEKIVPIEDKTELKESEDDKIKKEIITYLSTVEDKEFIPYESWIAWLEKQTTPKVRTGIEWVNTIDDACDKRYSEEYAYGEYCHEQSFKWGFQEGVEWLEKQGEQKPIGRKDFISIPFGTDSEFIKEAIAIPDGCVATIEGRKIFIRKK